MLSLKIHTLSPKIDRFLFHQTPLQKTKFFSPGTNQWTNFYMIRASVIFFFCLGFLSRTFTNYRTAGEGEEGISLTPRYHFYPLYRHLGNGWAIAAGSSAHSWQADSNREPLVSGRQSITTKLRALRHERTTHFASLFHAESFNAK